MDTETEQPAKIPLQLVVTPPDELCVEDKNHGIRQLDRSPGAYGSFDFKDGSSGIEVVNNQHNPAGEKGKGTPVDKKYHREQQQTWDKCLMWVSQHISVKEWKRIIRYLFAETRCSERSADVIIDEMVMNNPNSVTEQFYSALRKWYQLMERRVDLQYIVDALDNVNQREKADELKLKFPTLLKERQNYSLQIPGVGSKDFTEESALPLAPSRES